MRKLTGAVAKQTTVAINTGDFESVAVVIKAWLGTIPWWRHPTMPYPGVWQKS